MAKNHANKIDAAAFETAALEAAKEMAAAMLVRLHDRHLTERAAAERLGITPKALQNWRQKGGGPRYRKFGSNIRYALSDLIAFEDAASRTSTAEDSCN
jgi:hypothetical protein